MRSHLAQANIARLRAPIQDAAIAGLLERIEAMNHLAEKSPGFVWRLEGSDVTLEHLRVFDNYFVPFEPERLFYNMSVWESVEHLHQYTYNAAHAEMLRQKHEWISKFERPHLVLWWIPAGHRPSIDESARRFRILHERGPTSDAFTFKDIFPSPAQCEGPIQQEAPFASIAHSLGRTARASYPDIGVPSNSNLPQAQSNPRASKSK